MRRSALLFPLLWLSLAIAPATAQIGLSASVGSLTIAERGWSAPHLDFTASLWRPIDQMVWIGISSGLQLISHDEQVPLLTSLYVRLPIGRQLLPIATADWGYLFGKNANAFIWRAGGGLDLKLGNHSSIIALLGAQMGIGSSIPTRPYARIGLLLEL